MTDVRATERLLEVIQESASEILQGCEEPAKEAGWILEATRELRRRGDTLVRRDDLLVIADGIGRVSDDIDAARVRIRKALSSSSRNA